MLKMKDLEHKSGEELEAQYEDLCREIFNLSNELRMSKKLAHPHQLKEKKKDRARVLTALRQKRST